MKSNCIAVALPWLEGVRALYLGDVLPPLDPAVVLHPCTDCGEVLAVGPLVRHALEGDDAIDLCCPACAVLRCGPADTVIEVTLQAAAGAVH
jgi:hypothetical protein